MIRIEAIVKRHQRSRVEYTLKARSQFKQKSTANNVLITIPVPNDVDSPKFKASMGKVQYKPEADALVWSIKQFQGGQELMLVASFGLPSVTDGNFSVSL